MHNYNFMDHVRAYPFAAVGTGVSMMAGRTEGGEVKIRYVRYPEEAAFIEHYDGLTGDSLINEDVS